MCLILTLTRISDKSVEERSSVIKRADIYKNKLFLFFNNIFFNLSMQFDVLREKKNIYHTCLTIISLTDISI